MKFRDLIDVMSIGNTYHIITPTESTKLAYKELTTKSYLLDYEVVHFTPNDWRDVYVYLDNSVYRPSEDELEEANNSLEDKIKILRGRISNLKDLMNEETAKYESRIDDYEDVIEQLQYNVDYWRSSYDELFNKLERIEEILNA